MGRRAWAAAGMCVALLSVHTSAPAQLNCSAGVEFYASGAIRACTLSGHHRRYLAQGYALTCAHGHVAVLYADGKLQSCTLGQALALADQHCAAGSRVELNPDGTLRRCTEAR